LLLSRGPKAWLEKWGRKNINKNENTNYEHKLSCHLDKSTSIHTFDHYNILSTYHSYFLYFRIFSNNENNL
jgi:hypothetical protein